MDIILTLVLLTNQSRATSLVVDKHLTQVAQARAEYICNDFSHNKFREQVVMKIDKQWVGENLAIHFNDAATLHQAWINSPTHKANIIEKKYKKIGIARAKSCNAYVQIFSN